MRLIAALLSFSVALVVFQSTDQAAAAVQTFRPSADTYVDQAYPNRSFGSAKRLRVGAGSRPAKQATFASPSQGLAGSVSQAKLRFFVTNGTRNGPAVYKTGAWPRKPLTWARRPAVVSGPRDNKGRLVRGTWVEWDVTPWVTRDGVYRFALKGGRRTLRASCLVRRRSRRSGHSSSSRPDSPTVVYVAPTQGATVSGVTTVRVRAPAGTNWIGVYAWTASRSARIFVKDANGQWSVQWDTRSQHARTACKRLDTWAFRRRLAFGQRSPSPSRSATRRRPRPTLSRPRVRQHPSRGRWPGRDTRFDSPTASARSAGASGARISGGNRHLCPALSTSRTGSCTSSVVAPTGIRT